MQKVCKRNRALGCLFRRQFSSSCRQQDDIRPPTAPKQFPDLKAIASDPKRFAENATARHYFKHTEIPAKIAEHLKIVSEQNKHLVGPRKDLKLLQHQYGKHRADKDEAKAAEVLQAIKDLQTQIESHLSKQKHSEEEAHRLALTLPNLTSEDTPKADSPKLLKYINYDPSVQVAYAQGADHSIIGQELGIIDFNSASTATGWGFYYLLDEAALLEQALIQYATSVARKHGWRLLTPPSLVYSHIADSCGFQPRDVNDEQQIWQIEQKKEGKPKRSLAATAEIPLAALYANKAIPEKDLPLKLIGSSRCYRAEAGARGVDTRGLYRVHEFSKVEMFAWTNAPKSSSCSEAEWIAESTKTFDEMVGIQIEILSSLGLPCRVLEMPGSDLGASAYRKIDIEAQFPSRMSRDEGWGELTSVSICTDYQSRRLDTRILEASGARSRFPHTINGTAMAVPRVLACILEHGWREEQRHVVVPEVLRPFMNGLEYIEPR